MSQETTQKRKGVGLVFTRAAKCAAALGTASALAVGGATAANATTTAGHVDIVGWQSTTSGVGTIFGSTFDAWPVSGTDNEFEFTNPTSGEIVTCSGGEYTIPENSGADVPTVGFTNHSGATQAISLTAGGDYVEFIGEDGYSLISDDGPSLFPERHEHGDWVLQKDGSTTCNATETFDLSFIAGGTTQSFTFEITL